MSRQSRGGANRLQKSDVANWLHSRQGAGQQRRGRAAATADSLPPELLLRIFHHLSPRSLVSCSLVCRLWADLAASESLWRPICRRCFPKQLEPFGAQLGANCGVWKATFFNRLRKHATSRKYLNSLSNLSTGDFRVTLDFLGDSGRSLEASMSARVRKPGRLSSIVAFCSSAGSNCLPSDMRRVSQLVCRASFPAAHPDLLPPRDCPRRTVVLFSRSTGCQPLSKLSRDSRDGDKDASCVTIRLLGDGLLVGEWASTGEKDDKSTLSFVRLLLSHEVALNAARAAVLGGSGSGGVATEGAAAAAGSSKAAATVSRSIRRGTSTSSTASAASIRSTRGSAIAAAVPAAALLPSQVSGLSAVLILKEHRGEEFVFNTWRCLDLTAAAGDWLACELIDPRRRGDHVPYDCEPEFRWRAGPAGLEGRVGDACYCDFVLHGGPGGAGSKAGTGSCGAALWSVSEPAFFAAVRDEGLDGASVEYEYDGPRFSLTAANSTGRLRLLIVKDAIGGRGYLVGAWLELSSHDLALREA